MQFFLSWGLWKSVGTALQDGTDLRDAVVIVPLCLPREAGMGVGVRVFSLLEIWAPNMFSAEAEPLAPYLFSPPPPPEWPAFLLNPIPRARGGSGSRGSGRPGASGCARAVTGATPPPPLHAPGSTPAPIPKN